MLGEVESKLAQRLGGETTFGNNNSAQYEGHQMDSASSISPRSYTMNSFSQEMFVENMSIPIGLEYNPTEDPSLRMQYLDEMGLQEAFPPEEMQEEL